MKKLSAKRLLIIFVMIFLVVISGVEAVHCVIELTDYIYTGGEITISKGQARKIARNMLPGGDGNIALITLKKDYDDGRILYEGKIYHDWKKYEFEIDAVTGILLDWEMERMFD